MRKKWSNEKYLKAVGRTDNDDRVTADDGRRTPEERVVAVQYPALPGELVLPGVLATGYSAVDPSTAWREEN